MATELGRGLRGNTTLAALPLSAGMGRCVYDRRKDPPVCVRRGFGAYSRHECSAEVSSMARRSAREMVDMLRMNTTLVNLSGLGEVHTREVADVLRGNTTLKSLTFMHFPERQRCKGDGSGDACQQHPNLPHSGDSPLFLRLTLARTVYRGDPNNSGLWTVSRDGRHNSEKTQEGSLNYAHLVKKNEFVSI